MATMVANFTFKGLGASVLREQVKNYLIKEFVARRNVFVDLLILCMKNGIKNLMNYIPERMDMIPNI